MKKIVVTLAGALILLGCSEDRSRQKSIVECMMSAEYLNRGDSWDLMNIHAEIQAVQHHFDLSPSETKQLRNQIGSEWKLDSLSDSDRRQKLVSVFESPTCKAMQM